MTAVMLASQMKSKKAVDVLYHEGSLVSEFSRSNIFIVDNGKIKTPGSGILHGITRGLVLNLASQEWNVEEGTLSLDDVLCAEEVFMTSTIKRILPVVRIDDHIIGQGVPGKMTKHLMQMLNEKDIGELASGGIPSI